MEDTRTTSNCIDTNSTDAENVSLLTTSCIVSSDTLPYSFMTEDAGNIQERQPSMENGNDTVDLNLVSDPAINQDTILVCDLGIKYENGRIEIVTKDAIQEKTMTTNMKKSTSSELCTLQQNSSTSKTNNSIKIGSTEEHSKNSTFKIIMLTGDENEDNLMIDDNKPANLKDNLEDGNVNMKEERCREYSEDRVTHEETNTNNGKNFQKPGPIFHGLKRKPVNMEHIFKQKKSRNIFDNLQAFAENNENELSNQKSDQFSDDIENDESQMSEDILKNKCLTIKVTVQLEALDITKLSPDIKSDENKASSEMEKKKVAHKTESKFGKYGKKKKKKPSAKLLREIDKKPAKRFKKVPVAEMMWKKIQKMEKTGVNLKLREGRRPIKGEFPCNSCDYVAKQKSHLVAHRSIHSQKFVKCKYCKFESRSESKLMEHEARHSGDKPFICKHEGCDYAGVCKGDLSKHQRKHQTTKPCKCPHCDFTTRWPRNIQSHLLTHSDERPHKCKLCGYAFKRSCDLKYHMYRHNDSKPIKCEQCDFRCKTNFEIKCHMLKHSDVRYFKCTHPGCTQETKTKSDLTKHMKIHCKSLDFTCDLCGKGFKTKCSLKKHMLRHSDERPWKCDICGRGFKLKPALRNHINMHANYKPHSCEICGMLFGSLGNKRTHMVVHSSKDRPLKCPICPYFGKTQDHILSHIGTMHGSQYAYFCEICKKPFKRYHLLQVHYPRCHTKEEMAFMESALQLNIQAIKAEVVTELSSSELAKKNAEMDWDCIVVKDERCDNTVENQQSIIEANETKPDTTELDVPQGGDISVIDHKESSADFVSENENKGAGISVASSDEDQQDIKCTKQELCDNSFGPSKPATIAIYDGFRLPLATAGFHFNFTKKGKKTNAWFMDSKLMDETARKRHIKYLKKKQEQVLYGYYNSKRRRRINVKLSGVPLEKPKKEMVKREFAGGKFIEKAKGETNTVKNFLISKALQKVAVKPISYYPQLLERRNLKKVKQSQKEVVQGPNVKFEANTKSLQKSTKFKTSKEKGIPKSRIDRLDNDNSGISKINKQKLKDGIPVKAKGKPGRKPKVPIEPVSIKFVKLIQTPGRKSKSSDKNISSHSVKLKGKPGRKPKINDNGITQVVKQKVKVGNKNGTTQSLQSKGEKAKKWKITVHKEIVKQKKKPGRKPKVKNEELIKPKGKPGRKPKITNKDVSKQTLKTKAKQGGQLLFNDADISTDTIQTKGKPGRKPNNIGKTKMAQSIKPKGKPGRKPKRKDDIVSLKFLIPKKKPGRKSKIKKMAELANQNDISLLKDCEIKQEKVNEFDLITADIDDLLTSNTTQQNVPNTSGCQGNNDSSHQADVFAVSQDFGQSCDFDDDKSVNEQSPSKSFHFDQIKSNKRQLADKNLQSEKNLTRNRRPKDQSGQIIMVDKKANYEMKHLDKTIKYKFVGRKKYIKKSRGQLALNTDSQNGSAISSQTSQMALQPKKRGRKKKQQPEVVIENAEELDSGDVYPVSLQTASGFRLPRTNVLIKEEMNILINKGEASRLEDNSCLDINRAKSENILVSRSFNPTDSNGHCDDVIPMRSYENLQGNGEDIIRDVTNREQPENILITASLNPDNSNVAYCDDVIAMRRYENLHGDDEEEVVVGNEMRCNDKIININERSTASHLGIRIENVQSTSSITAGDESYMKNDNVIVQLVDPLDGTVNIISRTSNNLVEENINLVMDETLIEIMENSSPIKEELVCDD